MKAQFISYSVTSEELYDEEGDVSFGDDYWIIEKIYVPSELRGQGIARKMLVKAIEEMKAEHPEYAIRLVCEAQDDETDQELLAKFYESVGFDAVGDDVGTMELN